MNIESNVQDGLRDVVVSSTHERVGRKCDRAGMQAARSGGSASVRLLGVGSRISRALNLCNLVC